MLMHQEHNGLFVLSAQPQSIGSFSCDATADFTVILDKTLAEIMDKQCQMQNSFVLKLTVQVAERRILCGQVGDALHGANAMSVHRILVIFVELK